MLLEGCQGKKGVQIRERRCPNCGCLVEMMSTDLCVECDNCGATVYGDLMDCALNCPEARQCIGDAQYEKLMEAKAQWRETMGAQQDDDEW